MPSSPPLPITAPLANLSVTDAPHTTSPVAAKTPPDSRGAQDPEKEAVLPRPQRQPSEPVSSENTTRPSPLTGIPSIWDQPPLIPVTSEPSSNERTLSTTSDTTTRTSGSVAWDPAADISTFDAFTSRSHGLPDVGEGVESQYRSWEEQKAWEQSERTRRDQELAAAAERAAREEQERRAEEEWHRGEADRQAQLAAQGPVAAGLSMPMHTDGSTSEVPGSSPVPIGQETGVVTTEIAARPELNVSIGLRTSPAQVDTPRTRTRKQRSETYQIKHVTWVDHTSPHPRQSPILVQNANGPCPLLALVNALTLSTPREEATALVETLRVREQVSLGLLLDAVFDELMSGRRGDAAQDLPDVGDLYTFLITLHTGMNVNPRFIPPTPPPPNLMDDPELPTEHDPDQPTRPAKMGSFEETREMRLYSTFSVPLIHGWLPYRNDAAFQALNRSAKTYEDAQNLLFREEELDEKLRSAGLTSDEEQLLQDVATIKFFLEQTATQVTQYGLDTMIEQLNPGAIAILFRNDHFSTLYKHPETHQLFQLVTDMGYAGHEEVVWESLQDVTGERSEFLAGDFRAVGNNNNGSKHNSGRRTADTPPQDLSDPNDDGWVDVKRRGDRGSNFRSTGRGSGSGSGNGGASSSSNARPDPASSQSRQHALPPPPPPAANMASPVAEQEDHDLALALQLQEEEDIRHRREMAWRRQEADRSHQYINGSPHGQPPPPSVQPSNARGSRRSGRNRSQDVRPLVPPAQATPIQPRRNIGVHRPVAPEDVPPPSYEQAASRPAYFPPPEHPAHAGPPPPRLVPNSSAYAQNARTYVPSPWTQPARPAAQQVSPTAIGGANGRRTSMRVQAGRLIDEVTSPGPSPLPSLRRRQSAGPSGLSPEDEYSKKDCVIM
ncbi:MAG: hypothetical protein M1838_003595 [Thelocarpon superellum]|nr:MAG: hypothetical protein M1838_003595 [Thelocarpon superellum]